MSEKIPMKERLKDASIKTGKQIAHGKIRNVLIDKASKNKIGAIGVKAYQSYNKVLNTIKNIKRLWSVLTFLFTNPIGWGILGVSTLLIGGVIVGNNNQNPNLSYTNQQTNVANNLSDEETAAIAAGCDVSTASSSSKDDSGSSDGGGAVDSSNPFLAKIGGNKKNVQPIITRLKNEGFSGGHIAILLAVGARESGLDPSADNPSGGVHGVWQWSNGGINGDRMAWLRNKGGDINSLNDQLDLMMHELSTSYYSPVIKAFNNHQTTSDSDLEAVLDAWETYFEGLAANDGQRNTSAVMSYIKGVLEAYPELNDIKQSANFLQKFSVTKDADDNKSNSVSETVAKRCGVSADSVGGDALAKAIINAAFRYYGGNIVYSQGSNRGQVEWNSGKTKVTGGFLDCSSFVMAVLNDIGLPGIDKIGNTETLFSYEGKVFQEISRSEVTTGDIFVVGTPGMSSGNGGHTGIFLNKNWVIHCTSISDWINNGGGGDVWVNAYPENNFGLEAHFYRIKDRTVPDKANDVPKAESFIDITTNEALKEAINSKKIVDKWGVDAGQSEADLKDNAVVGSVNTKPNYSQNNAYPVGQCTWGAKAMAPWAGNNWGNGGQWAASARAAGFKTGKTPKPGALVSWDDGGYGHVAYVIAVKSDFSIQVMEANYAGNQSIANHRGWFDPRHAQGEVTYIYPK